MSKRCGHWLLVGGVASSLVLGIAGAAVGEGLMEDLGHRNWEEVQTGYFLAAELVYQQSNLVVFDTFVDPGLQYGRFAGDCDAMRIKQLRFGGISASEVEFVDVASESEIRAVQEEEPFYTLLQAACQQRE